MASSVQQNHKSSKSMKDKVKSFFGLDEAIVEPDSRFWFESDELLSATMSAHRMIYGVDDALVWFFNEWNAKKSRLNENASDEADRRWIKSMNLALEMLVEQGDIDKAAAFFDGINAPCRTPDTYSIMANGYQRDRRWNDITACYNGAKKVGCLSEALCLSAMKGIVQSETSGKIKILRSVADEIAAIKGVKTGAWIVSNYWALKRLLGFHYARLLMWWNNPNETQRLEFRLASQHFTERKKLGLAIDSDALKCIIKLARDQQLNETPSENGNAGSLEEKVHPPSLVRQALLEILVCGTNDDESQLLLEGMSYLSRANAKAECLEFIENIESSGLKVDDQIIFMARTTAESEPAHEK